MNRTVGALIIGLGAGLVAQPAPTAGQAPGRTAVVCVQGAPATLNPMVSPDLVASDLKLLLYTPLVLYGGGGSVRPYLATRWKWSADQRDLRLEIRRDVRWQDGQPLTAADVVFTLTAAADPVRLQGARTPLDIESITAPATDVVQVRFRTPQVAGLEPLVTLPVLPRHLLENVPAAEFARAPYNREPVGSGPYRLARRLGDGSLELERSPYFPAGLGRPALDRLVIRIVPEPAAIGTALATGEADLCYGGSGLFQQVRSGSGIGILPVPPTVIQAIPLNTSHPPLDDARVRRALSAALDRSGIGAVVSPLARPARSLLPEGSQWLDAASAQPDANPALAASLLASAGWSTIGDDGIRRNARGEPLRIQLIAPPAFAAPLTVVQAQLRRVGVDVEFRSMEWASYVGVLMKRESRPDAMALGYSPDRFLFPDYTDQLSSTSGRNLSSYASARVDSILVQLRGVLPAGKRAGLYRELQRRVAEDVPTIYTVYVPRLALVGPRLQGVRVDLNGPFASILDWRLRP
jgi:peptide/nickel transport system substrate-binding protein